MDDVLIRKIEAALFSIGKEISVDEIAKLVRIRDRSKIVAALIELKKKYNSNEENSLHVFQNGDRWKLTIKDEYVDVAKEIGVETELSKTVLETLAVIAYKNPIVQSEVIKVRTNKAYDHLKELEELGYISRELYGRSKLIRLTKKFFDYFDLPEDQMKEKFKKIEEMEQAIEQKEEEIQKRSEIREEKLQEMKKEEQEAERKNIFMPHSDNKQISDVIEEQDNGLEIIKKEEFNGMEIVDTQPDLKDLEGQNASDTSSTTSTLDGTPKVQQKQNDDGLEVYDEPEEMQKQETPFQGETNKEDNEEENENTQTEEKNLSEVDSIEEDDFGSVPITNSPSEEKEEEKNQQQEELENIQSKKDQLNDGTEESNDETKTPEISDEVREQEKEELKQEMKEALQELSQEQELPGQTTEVQQEKEISSEEKVNEEENTSPENKEELVEKEVEEKKETEQDSTVIQRKTSLIEEDDEPKVETKKESFQEEELFTMKGIPSRIQDKIEEKAREIMGEAPVHKKELDSFLEEQTGDEQSEEGTEKEKKDFE